MDNERRFALFHLKSIIKIEQDTVMVYQLIVSFVNDLVNYGSRAECNFLCLYD